MSPMVPAASGGQCQLYGFGKPLRRSPDNRGALEALVAAVNAHPGMITGDTILAGAMKSAKQALGIDATLRRPNGAGQP